MIIIIIMIQKAQHELVTIEDHKIVCVCVTYLCLYAMFIIMQIALSRSTQSEWERLTSSICCCYCWATNFINIFQLPSSMAHAGRSSGSHCCITTTTTTSSMFATGSGIQSKPQNFVFISMFVCAQISDALWWTLSSLSSSSCFLFIWCSWKL